MLQRLPALLALVVPCFAGLVYLSAFDAPSQFAVINTVALGFGGALAVLLHAPESVTLRRALIVGLLTLLFLPLATGPEVNGISRWLPLGPFTLHAGMLTLPPLMVLAVREEAYAAPIMLAALLAAFLQPDAATGFAITFAAAGVHDVTKDWKIGATAAVGFIASLLMAMRGELPPQPFVERVVFDLIGQSPLVAASLMLALMVGFFLMLFAVPAPKQARFALAGSLFGFAMMAAISHYPTPLIGYGASPILGYGLALGLGRKASGVT